MVASGGVPTCTTQHVTRHTLSRLAKLHLVHHLSHCHCFCGWPLPTTTTLNHYSCAACPHHHYFEPLLLLACGLQQSASFTLARAAMPPRRRKQQDEQQPWPKAKKPRSQENQRNQARNALRAMLHKAAQQPDPIEFILQSTYEHYLDKNEGTAREPISEFAWSLLKFELVTLSPPADATIACSVDTLPFGLLE